VLFIYSFYKAGLLKKHSLVAGIGLFFLFSGGIYNLSIRFLKGCVPDPLSFFNLFHFNYADILVTLGFLILGLLYLMEFLECRLSNCAFYQNKNGLNNKEEGPNE
jgi:lipoprotein signal peptidase